MQLNVSAVGRTCSFDFVSQKGRGTAQDAFSFSESTDNTMRRRWQPYRGTLAWLTQRISALALFVLLPIKIYSGYGAVGKLPWLGTESSLAFHVNAFVDLSLLFFLLLHAFYGLRVILIDVGIIREDHFFWGTAGLAGLIFLVALYYLYLR